MIPKIVPYMFCAMFITDSVSMTPKLNTTRTIRETATTPPQANRVNTHVG